MESYEVVIVGAGPAGLNCAERLVGKDVLVLESGKKIGHKVCAGGLTPESLGYLKMPDRIIERKFDQTIVHSTASKPISFGYGVYTIDRKRLGKLMLKRARDSGAEIRAGSKVTGIGNNHVTVNDSEKIGFKLLVGADGPCSIVRRHLGLKSKEVGMAFQYIVPGRYNRLEIFLDSKLFGTWYAWIFPHKGHASIGCGCDPKTIPPRSLKINFQKWAEEQGISLRGAKYEAHHINYDYRGHAFGRFYLAGDAGGFASGLTGEGIYQALVSGEEIARLISGKASSKAFKELLRMKKVESRLLRKASLLRKLGMHKTIERAVLDFFSE